MYVLNIQTMFNLVTRVPLFTRDIVNLVVIDT